MRIMFCLGSMTKGGAERVVANLANDFIANDDVSIVVTSPDSSSYELNDGIIYKSLDNINDKKTNIIFRTIRRIKRLKKTIKEINPDIIIALIAEPTLRVMLATYFHHIPTIISVRNDPKSEFGTVFKRILMRILYRKADGFIFQTEDAKQFFPKRFQKRSIIIPNPICEQFIIKPYKGKRNNHIVTVGRLVEQKNHALLIRAYNELLNENNDYDLYIYGDGDLKSNIKNDLIELVNNLGIGERVHFEGNVDNVKEAIYDAKMFVLSSDYEGMPNALMEAMALGVPCISTDCPCGGPKFLMKDKNNGLLIPVNNQVAMTNAMLKLINDEKYAKMIGDNANKIGKELNSKTINNKWYEYIKKVLEGK